MDTHNLEAFITVTEFNSFSKAAEHLHLTQPAVSKRIAALEQQLSCQLFDRIGRSISLTEAGKVLLDRAKQILQDVNDTQQIISDLSTGEITGQLSLAISHHIGLHRIPPILRAFSRRYPDVSLDMEFVDSEIAHNLIIQGKKELGIITLSPEPEPQVRSLKIWNDPLSFVVSTDHPLAQLGNQQVDLKALSHYPAILPNHSTYTGQIIEDLFKGNQFKLNVFLQTNYLETIKTMVSIGLGWSVLPQKMLDERLAPLKMENIRLKRQLGCIFHTKRTLSNAAKAFLSLMVASKGLTVNKTRQDS